MTHLNKLFSFNVALALAGVVACGGQSSNTPPQSATDVTMTTGAQPPAEPGNDIGGTYSATPSGTSSQVDPLDSAKANSTAPGTGAPMGGIAAQAAAGGPTPTAPGAANPNDSDGEATDTSGALDDGQIAAIIQVADGGEVAQAREAIQKAQSVRVKQFAQHMVLDHSAADAKLASLDTKAGITPKDSAISTRLRSTGDTIMGHLKASSGSAFDRAYMDAQVREHTKVLDLLDRRLISGAQNAELVKTLQDIRTKVASHLKMAQGIQQALGDNPQ